MNHRTRNWACMLGLSIASVVLLGAMAPAVFAAEDPLANDPVDQAIRKGVAWLYRTQKPEGHWETVAKRENDTPHDVKGIQYGGRTAIATYALLAAGENPQNTQLAKAIDWVSNCDYMGTYAMAMKLQIWNMLDRKMTPNQKQILKRDANMLMNAVKTGQNNLGLYHYWLDPTKGDYDHSCSNYGVLGMWAAEQQNLEVPTKYWEVVDAAWRKDQHKNGSWSYRKEGDKDHSGAETNSMTGAGVATLFITQDYIHQGRGECRGNIDDPDIRRGIQWLSQNYAKVFGEPQKLYAMYNIERVGTASGLKYFGTVDWYKDGAAHLVKTQGGDGGWGDVPQTCWALFFLVKGRAPLMMSKLEYAIDLHGDKGNLTWNERPRDIANLARWAGKSLEKEFNWQIVNLKVNIEDLHDAPILFISGDKALTFSKEDKAKLRHFVEGGGMILGHADCNSMAFQTSFVKLGQELYPQLEFRNLPEDHPIYTCHFHRKNWGGFNPVLKGLSNGARELMVLIPAGDPGRYWQIRNFSGTTPKALSELAINIFLYSCDKTSLRSKFKGQSYVIARNEGVRASQTMKVARLEYGSPTWDPEPGGWERFANHMHNTRGVDLTVEKVKLGEGKLSPTTYKFAHLTGTVKFKLTDAQKKELKSFAEGGGTLFIDAAGGAVDFKDSAELLLNDLFGADAQRALGQPLPLGHKLYTCGQKIEQVSYRVFARKMLVSALSTPRVRGIEVNNRTAVFYSAEDISVGLVGMTLEGIYGYEPPFALKIMENATLYALGATPAAVNAPAPKTAEPAKPAATAKKDDGKKPAPAKAADKPKPANKK